MSKIEEVARAMVGAACWDGTMHPDDRAAWLENARAAIEAMRQPTNAMSNAGTRCLVVDWELCCNGNVAPEIWDRMVSAALAEGEEG